MSHNPDDCYITSQEQLNHAVALIKVAKLVALDTEFTRETTYYPILSIIQIAVEAPDKVKQSFIIDCLSGLDLSEFFALIADPKITKILHSPAQDLQIFYQLSGLLPQGIVDSQLMANFCGFGFNAGYSLLVEKFFGRELNKNQQRSNWQVRPLSTKQIEYALLDVFFLEEIYQNFHRILLQKNRFDWFLEEMQHLIQQSLFKPDSSLSKNFSFRGKSEKQVAQIKNLLLWRESWAKKTNVPRQHFLKDEAIEKIVMGKNIRFGFSDETQKEMQKILDETEVILGECEPRERIFSMSEMQKKCHLAAKKLISEIAARENLQEQFLVTNSDLKKAICEKKLGDKISSGWRYQLFGQELEQLIFSS
jgi:ribonuclease D